MIETNVTTTLGNVTIGLSKPLKDLLIADLADDIVNAGGTDKRVRIVSIWGDGFPDIPTSTSGDMSSTKENDYASIYLNTSDKQNYSCGIGNTYSNGLYIRSVLVYIPDTDYAGNDTDYLYSGNQNDIRIVTNVNIQDVHMYADAHREDGGQINAEDANDIYINSLKPKLRDNETLNTVTARGGCIYPAWLIVIDDKVAIWTGALCRAYDNYGDRNQYGNGNYSFYSFDGINKMTVTSRMFDDDNTQIYSGGVGKVIEYIYSDIKDYKIKWGFYERYPYYWTAPVERVTKAMYMDYVSRVGLYFVVGNDETAKRYKPIITNGIVIGYSDDLSVESDIDAWTNVNGHNIPIIPPNTNSDEDDIESVGYGYFSNAVMGTLYSLYNKLDLEKIAQWFYNQTEKIDIANNVISLKEIPFSLSTLNIVPLDTDLKIGGVNVTYNNENIKVGQIVSPATTSVSVIFGEFNIPRLSNTFLDYSPYTKYELLLPFAPTPVTLPDWCVNKTVQAIFLYDIYTTACQYVIECNGERICSVSGIFGVDRPISAQNVALKDASRLSAQVATASSVLGGVMSASTGNIGGIMSGAIGGVSALSQMIMSGKQNYMYTVGANGDSSSVGLCHAVHLKITRTLSAEDSNFTHVYGRPLCKYKKLSSVTGYTKCDNVNTTGLSCSENEKQRIKQLLETGIYI